MSSALRLTLFGLCLCTGLAGCGLGKDEQEYIADARRLLAEGEVREADVHLRNVLQQNPSNVQARLLRAELSLKSHRYDDAVGEYRRARELGAPPAQYVAGLGQALLATRDYSALASEIDPAQLQGGERARALLLRGNGLLALGRAAEARADFAAAMETPATESGARFGLARLAMVDGEVSAARQQLQKVLIIDSNYVGAYQMLAALHYRDRDLNEARTLYERAGAILAQRDPKGNAALSNSAGLVQVLLAMQDSEAASAVVEDMLQRHGSNLVVLYLRGLVAYARQDYAQAEASLLEVSKQAPDFSPTSMLLGAVNFAQGQLEQANMYLSSFVASQPSSLPARKLLAAIRLKLDKPGEALQALQPVVGEQDTDASLLSMMGKASLRIGDFDQGVSYFERALRDDPGNETKQLNLAIAHLAAGDAPASIALLERLPQTSTSEHRRQMLLAAALLRDGKRAQAIEKVRAYAAQRPEPIAYNLAGGVHAAAGYPKLARTFYRLAVKKEPFVPALLNLADLERREGAPDKALQHLARAHQADPANLRITLRLAQSEYERGKVDAALGWLEQALTEHPQEPASHLAMARLRLVQREFDAADAVLAAARKQFPDNPALENASGLVALARGAPQDARERFERALNGAPGNNVFLLNRARAEMALGNFGRARSSLQQVLAGDPRSFPASLLLARIDASAAEPSQSLQRARKLQADWPGRAGPFELEGDIAMSAGEFETAERAYAKAIRLHKNVAVLIKQFQAAQRSGRADPEQLLARWLKREPREARVRQLLASYYLVQGNMTEAQREYGVLLRDDPDNALALNNLAWIYSQSGDSRAIETARRAHRLADGNPAIIDTLGWLLVQDGQLQEGTRLLHQAVTLSPENGDIGYHYAVALSRSGEREQARALLDKLLASGKNISEQQSAEQLLRTLQ